MGVMQRVLCNPSSSVSTVVVFFFSFFFFFLLRDDKVKNPKSVVFHSRKRIKFSSLFSCLFWFCLFRMCHKNLLNPFTYSSEYSTVSVVVNDWRLHTYHHCALR